MMTDDELATLLHDCPTLYHMAERGSWPSIRRHGLLSTSALLDKAGLHGPARDAVETQRRPKGVTVRLAVSDSAVIRDQKPMSDAGLRRCLMDGLTPEDWYRALNSRVFFWLSPARLSKLLGARTYAGAEHDVLECDAASLVAAYRGAITLSPINSGTTARKAAARGLATFLPIADYPYAAWRAKRSRTECVAELTVRDGVPDIARFVRRVTAMRGDVRIGASFERNASSA